MLTYSYSLPLVAASIIVAILAAFTGMALTSGISELSFIKRKLVIGMAAIVIGGGIWSMHFVALLALRLPVEVFYDLIWTTGSVLIAVLMAGAALLILHFGNRGTLTIAIAGSLLGYGVVTMHFVGMLGIRGCIPVFGIWGKLIPVIIGPLSGILAVWAAYRSRTRLNILLGSVIFGLSVSVIHYVGMYWTGFAILPEGGAIETSLDHSSLALLVLFATFLICAFFLLTSVTFILPNQKVLPHSIKPEILQSSLVDTPQKSESIETVDSDASLKVPYEKDGKTHFVNSEDVAVVQAEGHYSLLYTSEHKYFCPWSISNAMERLPEQFMRTHRSYIVNTKFVSGFVRHKDNGKCIIASVNQIAEVPISRSRLDDVKATLGL